MVLLIIIGLVMIYSSSYIWAKYKFNDSFRYLKHQLVFAIIGFVIMNIVIKLNNNFYYKKANLLLGICLLLLILVLIPGVGVIRNGSRSWFGIGPFGIQPSEAMKLALLIFSSKYLSKFDNVKLKDIIPLGVVIGIVFLLIMLQPDFGTGFILVMSIISIIFISGFDYKYFLYFIIFGGIGAAGLIIIAPYRMARILSFINPWKDPLGSGFQIIQSLYAIGPGGIFGYGLFNSVQKHFYLPEPQTDFIFSIICEELGIFGAFLVISLFVIFIYSSIKLALLEEDKFKKYVIFGIAFQIIFQTVLNLSVVCGLIPVTGVTLPFISYGGSSLLVSMASIGIILNISRSND